MDEVLYQHRLEYSYDRDGKRFPRLSFRISTSEDPTRAMDVDAYLDSGSERSLFNGWIATGLGLDPFGGTSLRMASATGSSVTAAIHPVTLLHDELGMFNLEVGFTPLELKRNLLGRDFFSLVQVGFREHHLCFYVTPEP